MQAEPRSKFLHWELSFFYFKASLKVTSSRMDLNIFLIGIPSLNEKLSLNVKASCNNLAVLLHCAWHERAAGAAFNFRQLVLLSQARPLGAVFTSPLSLISCLHQACCSSFSLHLAWDTRRRRLALSIRTGRQVTSPSSCFSGGKRGEIVEIKMGCAHLWCWICVCTRGWLKQREVSGLAAMISSVAQDRSSDYFYTWVRDWSVFLEYSDLVVANECSRSVALETNGAVMVLWSVFSLSYKFIFLNRGQDQRNVALKRKTLERWQRLK